jgi:short-subunit dehydrogenase
MSTRRTIIDVREGKGYAVGAAGGFQPGVAIVTGASAGLGRVFAVELARAATAVTVVARREAELEETARRVREEGVRCELVVGDVTEPGIAERTVAQTEATLGPVELLVANAGILGLGSDAEIDPSLWRCD